MAYINKSKTDDWRTPTYIYIQFMQAGYFDPCPLHSEFDGLSIEWGKNNFVNPPYGDLKTWINKAIKEARKNKNVILLIPSRTDTKAFHELYKFGCEFTFIIGRLCFNDESPAPFPSVLIKLVGDGKNTMKYCKRENIKL